VETGDGGGSGVPTLGVKVAVDDTVRVGVPVKVGVGLGNGVQVNVAVGLR